MMIKYGELTEDSFADLSPKKVKYIEKNGFALKDEDSKDELEHPVKIKFGNKSVKNDTNSRVRGTESTKSKQ